MVPLLPSEEVEMQEEAQAAAANAGRRAFELAEVIASILDQAHDYYWEPKDLPFIENLANSLSSMITALNKEGHHV